MTEDAGTYGGEPVRLKDRAQHAAVKIALAGLVASFVLGMAKLTVQTLVKSGAMSPHRLLGAVGGVLGLAGAAMLQLVTISTMNWQSFAELAFSFDLTPRIVAGSLAFAVGMGFVGGLLPAWRASRLAIVDALRAV